MVPSPCRKLAAELPPPTPPPTLRVPQSLLPPPGIPQPLNKGGKFIQKVCTWASGAVTCLHEPSLGGRLGRLGRPLLVCIGQYTEHVCACVDQELSCYLSSVGHKSQQTPTTEDGNASGLGFLPGQSWKIRNASPHATLLSSKEAAIIFKSKHPWNTTFRARKV